MGTRGVGTEAWERLLEAARSVRDRAHAPYSHYRVGAALLDVEGRVFAGCNVENASYGLTMCAERVALGSAVSAGARHFLALVLVTPGARPMRPCGACRQVLVEFEPSFPVRCHAAEGNAWIQTSTARLLPHAFRAEALSHR